MKIFNVLSLLSLTSGASARSPFSRHISTHALLSLRGGDAEAPSSTGSYHGNYISPVDSVPNAAQSHTAVVASPPEDVPLTLTLSPPVTVAPVATPTNSKLSNFQERAPPAILMFAAASLLLRFLGQKGLIGLVLIMQWAMYSETTTIVSDFNKEKDASEGQIVSFGIQKWWWFLTALMVTSGRYVTSYLTE